jgi:Mg-chelatase subunit ChlD
MIEANGNNMKNINATIILHENKKPVTLILFLIIILLLFLSFITQTSASKYSSNYPVVDSITPMDGAYGSLNDQTRSANPDPARLEVEKTVERKTIFVNGSDRKPTHTKVTITVKGVGQPGIDYNPQDVVFVMDNSDSMDENDNEYKRIEALKLYLQKMLPPDDRAALVKFSSKAELVNDHHLTSDYDQIIADLPALWHTTGHTNLGAAIELANQELIEFGNPDNLLIQILLTDGRPEPPENNVTIETINEAIENNIKIYTVGLGKTHDPDLLRWIAVQTGGKYYYAKDASDLLEIYDELSKQNRNYTAGLDLDITDSEPLLRDVIPNWIDYNFNSFSIKPDHIGFYTSGAIKFEWNIKKILIGETWSVSYNITSNRVGEEIPITVIDLARVQYYGQDETTKEVSFKELNIRVLPKTDLQNTGVVPPPPPPSAVPTVGTEGFPLPAAPTSTPLPIATTPPVPITAGATPAAIPVQYLFAGFLGLGIAERIKHIRMIKTRQKVALGV